jgi:hypothetical protein
MIKNDVRARQLITITLNPKKIANSDGNFDVQEWDQITRQHFCALGDCM